MANEWRLSSLFHQTTELSVCCNVSRAQSQCMNVSVHAAYVSIWEEQDGPAKSVNAHHSQLDKRTSHQVAKVLKGLWQYEVRYRMCIGDWECVLFFSVVQ